MARLGLTEARIAEAKAAGKRYLWDGSDHGKGSLGVYFGKGRMSYVFKYVYGKQEKQVTVGTDKELTLRAAQKIADDLRDKRESNAPIVSAKVQRIAEEKAELAKKSVSVHFANYYAYREDGTRYWREVKLSYDKHVAPVIGHLKISEVTEDTLLNILDECSPSAALYIYTYLNPFFKWCKRKRFIKLSPMLDMERPDSAEARDRILGDAEIIAFWQSCDKLSYPFGPMCKLLLLTAQRRDEVAGLRWEEIDPAKGIWTIPKTRTKNGKAHTVHLSPQALAVLDGLPRLESEFAFTTMLKAAVSGYSKVKARLDKLMASELGKDIEAWRLHDLRRTAASAMRGLRVHKDTIELVLNHTSGERGGLVGVYQRHELIDERKEALIVLGRYIESLTTNGSSNVIAIRRGVS